MRTDKLDEVHVYLDRISIEEDFKNGIMNSSPLETYIDTLMSIEDCGWYNIKTNKRLIRTTIPHFLSFKYADTLVVHYNGKEHVITKGECEGTSKEIREAHNIEKMLFAGAFDWF